MFINEAIKQAMRNRGMTLSAMATAIGKKRPNDVSARLAHNNMSFSTAIEMLSVLGYEVVVQEKRAGNRREDQLVITYEQDNEEK